MNSDQIITIIVAVVAACGAAMVTGLMTRPKVRAEAGAAEAGGQVAISGDAREWAREFALRATAADQRAQNAEAKVADVERRCDELDEKFRALVVYTQQLQGEVVRLGGHPAKPPAILTAVLGT